MSEEQSSQFSSSTELKRTRSDFENELSEPAVKKKNIMTPELVGALDRTGTSDRNAMHIISAVVVSAGLNVADFNLSISTIRSNRIKLRKQEAMRIKNEIQTAHSLVVHWDGKLLPKVTGSTKVEILPIVITGIGTEELLGVPKLQKATGHNQAMVIIETLIEWGVTDRVKAMCYDTTSVNTGNY